MPELPEVETSRLGLEKLIIKQTVKSVFIYQPKLRFLIPISLTQLLPKNKVIAVKRRAKYLLIEFNQGSLLVHLGMSGSLCVVDKNEPLDKHEHFVIDFVGDYSLRLKDPRRFGCVLWMNKNQGHFLLDTLGVEPLEMAFDTIFLHQVCKNKKRAIKSLIMDSHIVVGIGNIYASEALFLAKIRPTTPAKNINYVQIDVLVQSIKQVLLAAIKQGGTTLQDFSNPNKQAGYFAQSLCVYGRANQPCLFCSDIITQIKQNGRSSYYCSTCQT